MNTKNTDEILSEISNLLDASWGAINETEKTFMRIGAEIEFFVLCQRGWRWWILHPIKTAGVLIRYLRR